ncbi:MAG TPA: SpoIIE family protein phosphatase, partial [Leptospiraceae bacterium]|nr:SpoIIE family protein phosphatase [Leptospiraceae bacterium]
LCLPLKNHGNTIGILYLENNLMPGAFTKSRIETVKLLSVQAVISIENARFYEELESKVKDRTKALNSTLDVIKKDLLIAQKIQQNTLPLDLERLGPLKFTIKYLPMTEVGGDFFDIIKVRSGVYRIFRADATGHGVQAALVTMAIKSEYENLKHTISEPTVMIDILNRTYQRRYSSLNSFFTCVVLDNNLHTDKLTYAFAGHPAQILIHNNEIIQLERTGKMIGLSKTMNLTSKQYDFVLGDKILLFTDGIFEEFNQEGELFGEEKFNSIIYKNKMANNEQIISQVLKEVTKFKGGLEQDDDITMIGIEL